MLFHRVPEVMERRLVATRNRSFGWTLLLSIVGLCAVTQPSFAQYELEDFTDVGKDVAKIWTRVKIDPLEVKSTRSTVRKRLAKGGWTVVYGKEIGLEDYADLGFAGVATYMTGNIAPLEEWLSKTISETLAAFQHNADFRTRAELAQYSQQILNELITNISSGHPVRRSIGNLDVEVGIATYRHEFEHLPGVPAQPNSHQPYIRYRMRSQNHPSPNGVGGPPMRWIVTIYNPTMAALEVSVHFNGVEFGNVIPPQQSRDFWVESRTSVECGAHFHSNSDPRFSGQLLNARPIPFSVPYNTLGTPYCIDVEQGQLRLVEGRPIPSRRWRVQAQVAPGLFDEHLYEWIGGNIWRNVVIKSGAVYRDIQLVEVDDDPTAVVLRNPNAPEVVRLNWYGSLDVYDFQSHQWRVNMTATWQGGWIP